MATMELQISSDRLRGSPKINLLVVMVAFFSDSFLYGLVIPLTEKSPAEIQDEWVLGVGGWGLLQPLLPNHLRRHSTASPGSVGLMFTVSILFYGLSAPWVDRVTDRWGTGGYAAVYAVYNIAYAVGKVGSNVLAGALANRTSFLAALLITAGVMLAFVPVLSLARPPREPVTAAPNPAGP